VGGGAAHAGVSGKAELSQKYSQKKVGRLGSAPDSGFSRIRGPAVFVFYSRIFPEKAARSFWKAFLELTPMGIFPLILTPGRRSRPGDSPIGGLATRVSPRPGV